MLWHYAMLHVYILVRILACSYVNTSVAPEHLQCHVTSNKYNY